MNGSAKLYIRSENLSWRRVGDEVVVLDLNETVYLTLNSSGAVLWELLDGGATQAELAQALVDRFPISLEEAASDVDAFVERCVAEKVLKITED